jgi:hypothetical protein
MPMPATLITVELPEELAQRLGPLEALAGRVRESFVLELLREAEITQGEAAILLNVTRYDILDLMARHRIPTGPQTAEEARRDIEAARRGLSQANASSER